MRKIAVVNQKGGVGKTTTAYNISACLGALGKKVLLIDADSQANATLVSGYTDEEIENIDASIYELLIGQKTINETIIKTKYRYDLVPSTILLSSWETKITAPIQRELIFSKKLREIEGKYDYVIIDCPPSLSLLVINILLYADELLIPIQTQLLSMRALRDLFTTLTMLKDAKVHRRRMGLLTMYDQRRKHDKKIVESVKAASGGILEILETIIRINVDISDAKAEGKPIADYNPLCAGAEDYKALAFEIDKKGLFMVVE